MKPLAETKIRTLNEPTTKDKFMSCRDFIMFLDENLIDGSLSKEEITIVKAIREVVKTILE